MRERDSQKGFSCDACGAELFDYPTHRLCNACEEKMYHNSGKVCAKCGRKTETEGICLDCKRRLPQFTKGISPFVYRGESASLINRMKNGASTLSYYFAEKMADRLIECYENIAAFCRSQENALLILPVPLTNGRRRERGYNQAEELAMGIHRRLKEKGYFAEIAYDVLQKRRDTKQQKHMGYLERMENVSGAYHVHKRKECRGKTVILVDDIMTTGATGSECAERLLGADARAVIFLTAVSLPEKK